MAGSAALALLTEMANARALAISISPLGRPLRRTDGLDHGSPSQDVIACNAVGGWPR